MISMNQQFFGGISQQANNSSFYNTNTGVIKTMIFRHTLDLSSGQLRVGSFEHFIIKRRSKLSFSFEAGNSRVVCSESNSKRVTAVNVNNRACQHGNYALLYWKFPMMHHWIDAYTTLSQNMIGCNTQSRILLADWLILDNNEKATWNNNMPYLELEPSLPDKQHTLTFLVIKGKPQQSLAANIVLVYQFTNMQKR